MIFTKTEIEKCAQNIFVNNIADFLDWLLISGKLTEALWCAYDEMREDKNASRVGYWVRRNRWRQRTYDLLESGNEHLWTLLRDFAEEGMKEHYFDDCY